ncbi:PAS domain S-box protein [Pedobacter petrophilus]|uniref:histidine kinase n=1 Tax=Pedobacter petrophilus TaxID=1908241 RepID=A0A7K0G401_9SPHI|nr:ATP-binding protein [Pedobacter petrophilus]MRX78538.1 PAS domain S-box protein [Pedobacter petrophilus]
MSSTPQLPNKTERQNALESYNILDTLSEREFDDLTELSSVICGTPIALVSLVDRNRQWFKSRKGLDASETHRDHSFCAHAIENPLEMMEIEDAKKDVRFINNPLVTGQPHITFYAGVPLVNEDGFAIGSLCVIDSVTRKLTETQRSALKILATQVMDKMELRRKISLLEKAKKLNAALLERSVLGESRSNMLIQQAPIAIILFKGENFNIEAVNPPMLKLLGQKADILNQPLLSVIPELEGQGAYALLHKVFQTGETIHGNEQMVNLIHDGTETSGYYNFTYCPLIENGQITGVIDMAIDVTEQVKARITVEEVSNDLRASYIKLEQSEQKQSSAIEQAKLGTYTIDGFSGKMNASERLKEIFGYRNDEEMTYESVIGQVSADYRAQVLQAAQNVIKEGLVFDMEYTIIKRNDGMLRWVKSTGKHYKTEADSYGHFSGTILDITEEKEDDIRKDDFIGMVSHEMKTPLTSLKGFVQLLQLKAKKTDDSLIKSILDKADKQITKMTRMINGFLNVSRLESGKIHIEKEHFNIKDLIKEIEDDTIFNADGHTIIFDPVETAWVNADKDKIGQVINNFISNALKYSPMGTEVRVSCISDKRGSVVSVRDAGMGIEESDIAHLFERYYRVEKHNTKSIAGFGIGLYLCAEIMKRHNGKIWVESEIKNGSVFHFSLPAVAA